MYQFGSHECDPFYTVGPYARNLYLFHYVHSGKGELTYEDSHGNSIKHEIEAGQGFMICPKTVASYAADGDEPWKYYWVEFGGLKARELVRESGLFGEQLIYDSKDKNEQMKMIKAMRFMAENGDASPYELIGHCYLFLNALVLSSAYRRKSAHNSLQNFYVQEVLAYIDSHYHEDIRVEDLAAACNLDRSYVGKIFKSRMGTSLRDFLINYRVRKACELMKDTQHNIGEISAMVGYPNMFSFSRTFKAVMGQSPRQWRAENKLYPST
jgi:AraC-like DNA-binding protein